MPILALALALAACGNDDALIELPGGADTTSPTYVYVANENSSSISVFSVDLDSGELTEFGSPVPTTNSPTDLALHPSGLYLYSCDNGNEAVSGFQIDQETGGLTEIAGSEFTVGAAPSQISVTAAGEYLLVTNQGDSEVASYPINSTTGAVGSRIDGEGSTALPESIMVHPSGDYVYVPESTGLIGEFTFNGATGALGQVAGQPYSSGASEFGFGVAHPSGDFLFASELGSDSILTATVSGADGSLSNHPNLTEPVAGGGPGGLAIDAAGDYLYSAQASVVEGFDIAGNGTITSFGTAPKGNGEAQIAMDALERWLFVPNANDNTLSIYEIDPADGTFSEIADSPVNTGNAPGGILVLSIAE